MTNSCLSLKITVRGNHQKFKIPPPYMTYFDPKLEILSSKNSVKVYTFGIYNFFQPDRFTFFGPKWLNPRTSPKISKKNIKGLPLMFFLRFSLTFSYWTETLHESSRTNICISIKLEKIPRWLEKIFSASSLVPLRGWCIFSPAI